MSFPIFLTENLLPNDCLLLPSYSKIDFFLILLLLLTLNFISSVFRTYQAIKARKAHGIELGQ